MIKFTEYIVNNSITTTLADDKFDIGSPFNFIEYLNYVKVIDDNDLENFNQYKRYLEKWKETDFANNKNNKINIRSIYLNFFNDLTLKYSTQEQRRFFNTVDLNDEDSLMKIIPFYRSKIVEILNYYREKRNTFKRELREKQGKGSNLSVKDQIKNNIANFFTSSDYTGEPVSLSSLRVDVELGYDTFNDYYDINPASVDSTETYKSNNIDSNSYLNIDQALINVLNQNNITLIELNPFKLVLEFNELNTNFLQRDDFIDYKISSASDTYRVLYEAEISENLVGTDYFYLSTNTPNISSTETQFVSGKLFEAKNKAKNLFNINFPSVKAKENQPDSYERSIGLFFNPTKFSILKVDGNFINKIKPELNENFVYIFPDPSEYGDVVNLSNTKRENPFNFFFDLNTFKNISSSSSRNTVKADERNHYFHAYQSLENRRINITNESKFSDSITDLVNFGSIEKIETDIYGNEYIQVIPNKGVILNSERSTIIQDAVFDSGNTIDISENRYGEVEKLSGCFDKINGYKKIFVKDVINKELKPLSSSSFNIIYDKFSFNSTLYSQITGSNILDLNVYEDSFSIDLSSFSIVDAFKYDGNYLQQTNSPLIIEKDSDPEFSFITKDCYNNNSIYKFNISLSGLSASNTFLYELYKFDTQKKTIDEISTRNTETSTYFINAFDFSHYTGSITINKIINSDLKYNSLDDSYILTTTFNNTNNSIVIHILNYKIINNKISIVSNDLFSNVTNNDSLTALRAQVKAEATKANPSSPTDPADRFFNFLNGGGDCILPSLSFPAASFIRTITLAYSGVTDINFDLQNVTQSSNGASLYKAIVDYGDNVNETLYSKFQSDDTLKLDNFSHRYNSFNDAVSSTGSIKFYYENGNVTTLSLRLVKLIDDIEPLKLKAINGQKTNLGEFALNLIDKNNTLYSFITNKRKIFTRGSILVTHPETGELLKLYGPGSSGGKPDGGSVTCGRDGGTTSFLFATAGAFGASTAKPGVGYERRKGCLRGLVVVTDSNGNITSFSTSDGSTTNNFNLKTLLTSASGQSSAISNITNTAGTHEFVFEFFGWRRKKNQLNDIAWVSDDSKYTIYSSFKNPTFS
jgi:hypothetical protein